MNQEIRFAKGAPALDRILTLELVRVTERAAVAAARLRGRGDEIAADQAAVNAMRHELNRLAIHGTVVIGEGERDEAPMLFIGEEVGNRQGPRVDIALDPLEGTTIAAKNLPNAIAVIAIAETGTLLNAPDVYMDKIAIGPGYPKGVVDLDRSPADNIRALAKAKGVPVGEISACVLDRPRHAKLIEELRNVGAAIRLIGDGDVAGIIHATEPETTGIDIYLGIGGAPEGVLAAAALRCMGGQMQGRLVITSDEQKERALRFGVADLDKKYDMTEMARGDVLFAATGVTDGNLLAGVHFGKRAIVTHSVVMRASSGTVRWIKAEHQDLDKFDDAR
ncbi:MAG: class II fructose-bisphosphatase [Bauldia sp.]|nr:class II fructose-bisphosphatase [Bauldia sp.]